MSALDLSILVGAVTTGWVSMNYLRYSSALRTATWAVNIAAFCFLVLARNVLPEVVGVLYLCGFTAGSTAAVLDVFHTHKLLSKPHLPASDYHPEND